MEDEAQRVVLISPGDILLIGNLQQQFSERDVEETERVFRRFHLRAVFFHGDIDVQKLSQEQLLRLKEASVADPKVS
jgi:hypothetical protein